MKINKTTNAFMADSCKSTLKVNSKRSIDNVYLKLKLYLNFQLYLILQNWDLKLFFLYYNLKYFEQCWTFIQPEKYYCQMRKLGKSVERSLCDQIHILNVMDFKWSLCNVGRKIKLKCWISVRLEVNNVFLEI